MVLLKVEKIYAAKKTKLMTTIPAMPHLLY